MNPAVSVESALLVILMCDEQRPLNFPHVDAELLRQIPHNHVELIPVCEVERARVEHQLLPYRFGRCRLE